ncbi:c-type cytochrome [Bradyrhizobium sp. STM 3843]|uniref:c-type cytochrome n=1 Tax=Bradyrhizobium sp. STM 3843 TaxID=551947 RepID=UPI0005693B6C|nr:c-type cytochrome [Bradyrhizobium sp. STM 3843]
MSSMLSRSIWIGAVVVVVCVATVVGSTMAWSSRQKTEQIARAMTGGDPKHAPEIMRRYGCGGCHTIPGLAGADGEVGPPLTGLSRRVYIGGVANNSPDNLVQWMVSPQTFSPRTAMPATGITEAEARDVAAYLYSQ